MEATTKEYCFIHNYSLMPGNDGIDCYMGYIIVKYKWIAVCLMVCKCESKRGNLSHELVLFYIGFLVCYYIYIQ